MDVVSTDHQGIHSSIHAFILSWAVYLTNRPLPMKKNMQVWKKIQIKPLEDYF